MANTKFKLGEEVEVDGRKLHRIVALRDFHDVKQGDMGGLIEKEEMLDMHDDSWVYGDSMVSGEGAFITGNSEVYDNAVVESSVIKNSTVRNHSKVMNSHVADSYIHKSSRVYGSKLDDSYLSHDTQIHDSTLVNASLEAVYAQDAELRDIDATHIVQIGDEKTQMEMIDSFELQNYDRTNIHEYVNKYKAESIELSDDDLSDLNEQSNTLQR